MSELSSMCSSLGLAGEERKLGKEPMHGTLELMAQQGELLWSRPVKAADGSPFSALRRETLHCLPRFVERANASTLMEALERALPQLSMASLANLTKFARFVMLHMSSDLAPSNVRLLHYVGAKVLEHNASAVDGGCGMILFLDTPCLAHIVHRVIESTFRLNKLIPCLHSTAFTCSSPANLRLLARHLRFHTTHPRSNRQVCIGHGPHGFRRCPWIPLVPTDSTSTHRHPWTMDSMGASGCHGYPWNPWVPMEPML